MPHHSATSDPSRRAIVPSYSCSAVRWTPQQWRDAGKQSPIGTHDWSNCPSLVENWEHAGAANAGLELSQVWSSNSVVGWYWRCADGHLWREPVNRMFARNVFGRRARWRSLMGSSGACRRCALDRFGARFDRCGCISPDLALLEPTPVVLPGFCPDCKALGSGAFILGAPVLVNHCPPTSKEENVLRQRLGAVLPLASPGEANAVSVHTTSWGARHVFPDMLAPSTRVAIEYDSPGPLRDAHGPLSVDHEKDSALRRVGWEVIRVRVGNLALIGPYDVAAAGPTRAAAAAVIDQYHRVLLGGERALTHLAMSGDLRTSTQWEQLALDLDAQ